MQADQSAPAQALERLGAFIGEWSAHVAAPSSPEGRVVFEWALGGKYLVQRSDVDHPDVPDSLVVTSVDPDTGAYTQHYFDSRGVTRVYAMTLADGVWTLLRDTPDFSPLNFSQRFSGRFADDGDTIAGTWQTSDDGAHWRTDFGITYTRVR